jgi:hypothetical protein
MALAGFALLGVPFVAMQVLPFTIVAHVIRSESERRTWAEGSYTGVLTVLEKLGLALGPAITGFIVCLAAGPRTSALATFNAMAPPLLAAVAWVLLRTLQRAISTQTVVWPA